eukprot:3741860-Lingulodinium_polyedra.AAC.1
MLGPAAGSPLGWRLYSARWRVAERVRGPSASRPSIAPLAVVLASLPGGALANCVCCRYGWAYKQPTDLLTRV